MSYRVRSVPVTLDDGAKTLCDAYGERGPVVLCVHGVHNSRMSWSRLGERLADSHRVFSYDQRGHGDSADVLGPMTLERCVRDLMSVANSLPSVDLLVGHCWGGAVALEAGRRLGQMRMLAVDPIIRVLPGTYEQKYVNPGIRGIFAEEGPQREATIRMMFSSLDPRDLEADVHAMRDMSLAVIRRLGTANLVDEGGWDLRETVSDYPQPLTIARAGVGSAISDEDATFVRSRAGRNVNVDLFEEDGHYLHRTAFERFTALAVALADRRF